MRFRVAPAAVAEAALEVETVELEPPAASQPAPKWRGGRKRAVVPAA